MVLADCRAISALRIESEAAGCRHLTRRRVQHLLGAGKGRAEGFRCRLGEGAPGRRHVTGHRSTQGDSGILSVERDPRSSAWGGCKRSGQAVGGWASGGGVGRRRNGPEHPGALCDAWLDAVPPEVTGLGQALCPCEVQVPSRSS